MQKEKQSDDKIKHYIYTYNFMFVEKYLIRRHWLKDKITEAIDLYRDYIFLRYKLYPVDFPPSFEIDAVWKSHILHTQEYRHFCDIIFYGEYLDRSYEVDKKLYERNFQFEFEKTTQNIFFKEFGYILPIRNPEKLYLKLLRNFKKITLPFITVTAFLAIVGALLNLVKVHNIDVNTKYSALKTSIRNISYDEEETYLLCHSGIRTEHPYFFIQNLHVSHLSRRKHYADFLNIILNLKQEDKIDPEVEQALYIFSERTNKLYSLAFDVCDSSLRKPNEIDKNREYLTDLTWKSRQKFLWYPMQLGEK